MRNITQEGLELVKFFEGFRDLPYPDPVGIISVGYGHVVKKGENWTHLTETDGEDLLRRDVAIAEEGVDDLITVPLMPYQFDSIVSFAFNLGLGSLARSTLRKKVNAELHHEVPEEFRKWVYAGGKILPGLVRRREAEANMYAGLDWREVGKAVQPTQPHLDRTPPG